MLEKITWAGILTLNFTYLIILSGSPSKFLYLNVLSLRTWLFKIFSSLISNLLNLSSYQMNSTYVFEEKYRPWRGNFLLSLYVDSWFFATYSFFLLSCHKGRCMLYFIYFHSLQLYSEFYFLPSSDILLCCLYLFSYIFSSFLLLSLTIKFSVVS